LGKSCGELRWLLSPYVSPRPHKPKLQLGLGYTSESCPSKTTLASPERLAFQAPPKRSGLTLRTFSDRVRMATWPFARPQLVSRIAVATAPLPQAKVSPSTP